MHARVIAIEQHLRRRRSATAGGRAAAERPRQEPPHADGRMWVNGFEVGGARERLAYVRAIHD